MNEADELGDEDVYAEQNDLRAQKQEQLDRHKDTITGVFAEIDELDEMILKVVDRLNPLYTDPSLEWPGKEQRARIASTDARALWTRGSSSGTWTRVLPADALERQVREVVARQQDRRTAKFLEDQQDAAEDLARFSAGLAGAIGDARAAGGVLPSPWLQGVEVRDRLVVPAGLTDVEYVQQMAVAVANSSKGRVTESQVRKVIQMRVGATPA